ncbi:MAG TPA: FAD-dependent oxidoreductase [Pyrinomonadaceae bacterium]
MTGSFDVAVVGAGVFGAWTSYQLCRAGASVILIDAYGPANSRASSGGESRIIRLGYGPDEIYTRSAMRSFTLWHELFHRLEDETADAKLEPLFHRTGVLWLAHETDKYCEATLRSLKNVGAKFERLEYEELLRRYPQLELGPVTWGILESEAGALMARRAVRSLCTRAREDGVTYLEQAIVPPRSHGRLDSLMTSSGSKISADKFVFACGPWLPKLFPSLLGNRFHITRQEVFFFGVPAGDDRFNPARLPIWIDFNDLVYALPNVDGRGFKIAIDAHGPSFDPDLGERVVSAQGLSDVRNYLRQRVPALANAPVAETRVCQYENTANGDFLVDAHPEIENLWLVGGGSGHGFKHGPAVGDYVTQLIAGNLKPEPRFSLESKKTIRERKVY